MFTGSGNLISMAGELKPISDQLGRKRTYRRVLGGIFYGLFLASVCVGIIGLVVLLYEVLSNGLPWMNWQFITDYPSRHPEEAGLFSALMGTVWLMVMTALFTVPVGVGAAIYLEEYARRHWLHRAVQVNIANLAGVPSIVYGLLGLQIFVRSMDLGKSCLLYTSPSPRDATLSRMPSSA